MITLIYCNQLEQSSRFCTMEISRTRKIVKLNKKGLISLRVWGKTKDYARLKTSN